MTPECCACVSAERLRRPSGVSEHGLLGTWGCDHSHEALRTRGAAKHLHPGVCLCGLDQEGHGDGLETTNWPPTGTDQTHYWSPREQFFTFTHMHVFFLFFCPFNHVFFMNHFNSTVKFIFTCIKLEQFYNIKKKKEFLIYGQNTRITQ